MNYIGKLIDNEGNTFYPISNVYSEKEMIVGKWTNGKTLYRKVINSTCPNTTANGTWATTRFKWADNIDMAFIEWHFISNSSNQRIHIFFMSNAGYVLKCFIDEFNNYYIANNNMDNNGKIITASILYTKTSD